MRRIEVYALIAAVVAGIAGVQAASAMATEGPYYIIAGVRLPERTTEGVEVKGTARSYVLKASLSGHVVTVGCTGSRLANSIIIGSTGGNAGTSKERFEFTGCTQMGNGTECTVAGGTITTAPLTNTLGYSEAERKGNIDFLYKPESGTEIANVAFAGTCTVTMSAVLRGSTAAEALSKGSAIKVGMEPAAAEVLEINFPSTPIGKVWVESGGGAPVNETVGLEWGGKTATFDGQSELWLKFRENWIVSAL